MNLKNFTGRETELGILLDTFESCCNSTGHAVFLSGAVSSGKTSLVEKFVERLKSGGYDFQFFGAELFYFNSKTDFCAFDFLKKQANPENSDEVEKFLRQKAEISPVILFIDNLNYADGKSIDLLHFVLQSLKEKPFRMTVILSISTEFFNEKTDKILSLLQNGGDFFRQITLPPFKLADIAMYISKRFPKRDFSLGLSNAVREISMSDLLITDEVLDYLILSGFFYLSEDGVWKQKEETPDLKPKITFNEIEQLKIQTLKNSNLSFSEKLPFLNSLTINYIRHTLMNAETEKMLFGLLEKMSEENGGEVSDLKKKAENFYSKKLSFENNPEVSTKEKTDSEIEKTVETKDINEVFSKLEEAQKNYNAAFVIKLSEEALNNFSKFSFPDKDSKHKAGFELLRYQNAALSWAGHFKKAKEISSLMLKTALKYNLKSQIHFSYYTLGTDFLNLADYEAAEENIMKAVGYASQESDYAALSTYNSQLGMIYVYRQNTKEAEKFFSESQRLCQKTDDKETIAKNKINLGIFYTYADNYEMAEYCLKHLVKFFEKNGDKRSLSKTLGCLAIMYQRTEDYELSESYAQKAVKTDLEVRDNVSLSSHYNNLGLFKYECGKNEEALDYFMKSLQINELLFDENKTAVTCSNIGDICAAKNDTEKASSYYLRAAELFLKNRNFSGCASVYISLAEAYTNVQDYENAVSFFEKAIKICEKNSLKEDLVYALNVSGDVVMVLGDVKKALENYNKALEIAQDEKSDSGIITSLYNLGNAYLILNNYKEALDRYNAGLYIAKKNEDKEEMSRGYSALGKLFFKRTEYEAAILNYNYAIALDKELQNGESLASNHSSLGDVYVEKNEIKTAFENYEKAEEIFSVIGNTALLTETMRKTAETLSEENRYNQAQKKLEQALKICTDTGDNMSKALTLISFADVEANNSHYKKALDYLEKAQAELKNLPFLGDAYFDCTDKMADIYKDLKMPEEAVLIHLSQLEILKKRPSKEKTAEKYLDLAEDYKEQELNDKAEECYNTALRLAQKGYDRYIQSDAYFETGLFFVETDRFERGISMMTKAPKLFGENEHNDYRAANYYNITGDYQYDAGNYEDALECYQKAGEIYMEIGDKYKTAYIFNNIGYCYDTMSKFREALMFYQKSSQFYRAVNDIDGVINNIKNVALMYERLQEYGNALKYCQSALEYLEKLEADEEKGELCLETAENYVKAYSDYDKSREYVMKAYKHFKNAENFSRQISCLESAAMISIVSGDNENADSYLERIRREENYIKDPLLKIQIHKAAGNVCFRKSDFKGCMNEYFTAFSLSADLDNWEIMAGVYYEWANVLSSDADEYNSVTEFQSQKKTLAEFALDYYGNAIKIAQSSGQKPKTASDAYLSRALLNTALGRASDALSDFDNAAALAKENYPSRYISALMSKGENCLEKFRRIDYALDSFEAAYEAAVRHNFTDMKIIAKAYVGLTFFMTGHADEAKIILNEMKDYYDFIIKSVPALTRFL
ncbi:MAG: tetratricopeptide repeat protein [Bacteroidales bacterium]|nr:tetratricopeptide repeat protein [Bacteroidales bacterium]